MAIKTYSFDANIKKIGSFKKEVKPELIEFQQSQIKEVKKEMNRIFQVANRRIQNIRNSGVTSTALGKLNQELGGLPDNFTVFTNKGLDFTDYNQFMVAKNNYMRALRFINNKTSTATGARKNIKNISNSFNLPFKYANRLVDRVMQYASSFDSKINTWDSKQLQAEINDIFSEYNDYNADFGYKDMSEDEFNNLVDNLIDRFTTNAENEIDSAVFDIFDL